MSVGAIPCGCPLRLRNINYYVKKKANFAEQSSLFSFEIFKLVYTALPR